METLSVEGMTLYFDSKENTAAELIRDACSRSVAVIRECWGLEPPPGCTVFVMTSWLSFVFRSAPIHRKVLLALLFPVWCFRVKRIWKAAGGWVQGHGQAPAVGIKPPRLLENANRELGDKLFLRDVVVEEEVGQVTCHELTHAFSNHLRLPTWLHEGIAMASVDALRGRPSVRRETLDLIETRGEKASASSYPRSSFKDADAWVCLYARGYWLTRYLVANRPALLPALLKDPLSQNELESAVAAAFGVGVDEFWKGIDNTVVAFFKNSQTDSGTNPLMGMRNSNEE